MIDIVWQYKDDDLHHVKPAVAHYETIRTASLLREYEQKYAKSMGVPLYASEWDPSYGSKDKTHMATLFANTLLGIETARKNDESVVNLNPGQKLVPLGPSAQTTQIQQTQQYVVREVCRIYDLPPLYLHDMDRQTYNNSEQQSINLLKFTLNQWAEALEDEINLKILTRSRGDNFICRHNFEELLRGDLQTRFAAFAQAIQSGQMTPNEARAAEDRPPQTGGNKLMIQGATVPIEGQEESNSDQSDPDEGDDNAE